MSMQQSAVTNQVDVFDAIIERIRDQVEEFKSANTCFLVIDPQRFIPEQRQTLCLTVSPHSGQFDEGVDVGAGDDGVIENTGFTVTIWSRIQLDRPDSNAIGLTNASRGSFPLKLKILKALLRAEDGFQWMPTDSAGAPLLTDYIAPVAAGYPAVADHAEDYVTTSISFSCNWTWNLC